ncbi:DNA polymerase alpha-associated DNA helicase A [Neolecta irregularis DAH-3]|uniref:DNA helicase n=1 Tax=Neolecta irregularis (strain DAH-3) TaxID=1198029 RepID=A0A1U7LL01_NEOID|nr:DNA polymerase alpha-associated DNA helicase A [Neolecta irregularis DAH-3]|eukprot:OLL23201.1 DNA polymerase alpha-associated DNA helicase A [Neolecta irregularis DAH-3]
MSRDFANLQLKLLKEERDIEVNETLAMLNKYHPQALQKRGLGLTNLSICSIKTGAAGRTVIQLERDRSLPQNLPTHLLRTGDSVRLTPYSAPQKDAKTPTGVVLRITKTSVTVVLDMLDDEQVPLYQARYWIVKLVNDATFKRMTLAMEKIRDETIELTQLARILLQDPLIASPTTTEAICEIKFFDSMLNESQKEAVKFALQANHVAVIHGPPGTGKTSTLIELILQFLARGLKVLVCGPSNISVDNIVERLSRCNINPLRIGHPARLLSTVLNHCLEYRILLSDDRPILHDIKSELDTIITRLSKKIRNAKERKALWDSVSALRKEYQKREKACVEKIIKSSHCILTTCHGAGSHYLNAHKFDVVIIDEASQALEASCWIPILKGRKLVLAGDHLQLPPTIKSKSDRKGPGTLDYSLFDRLLHTYREKVTRTLEIQYRMHEKIMRFPSDSLYHGKLKADEKVKGHLLSDLPDVQETEDTTQPLIFYDTIGGNFPEQITDEEEFKLLVESKSNEMEALVVKKHVIALTNAGVKNEDIAVITPYNAQVGQLSILLGDLFINLEIGSVDGFQGREKEAVIVSLVRSNDKREIGFLAEKRRLNVAMTRPKRHLCIVGDSETVSRDSFLKQWIQFLEDEADVRYPDVYETVQYRK